MLTVLDPYPRLKLYGQNEAKDYNSSLCFTGVALKGR